MRSTPTGSGKAPRGDSASPEPTASSSTRAGYWELLRTNRNYRRLWIGDVASLLGDWLNTIALYTLVRELTGSSLALGLVFVTKMLPFALASPLAGLVTDRFNRRRLMIAADLARAVVVLGFLLVDEAREMPLLYALTATQVAIGAVFIPARSASIPNITTPRELLTANALSAATWSSLLALGAALGGIATDRLGVEAVFLLDSLSYVVSAFFIFRTAIPQHTEPRSTKPTAAGFGRGGRATLKDALGDILDGWRHLRTHPRIRRIALTKPTWAVGGAALVYMLALVGERWEPEAPAMGIGLLFAARGLGTGIGPIAARNLVPDPRRWPTLIGLGIAASGLAYLVTAFVPWGSWLLLLVLLAHVPSGANWVLSTVLLQQRTEDRYRGRVFSTEWLLLMLVDSAAILVASGILEAGWLDLRSAIGLFAGLQIVSGALWLALVVPRERRMSDGSEVSEGEMPGESPPSPRS